jgi:hypothetical protein
MRTNVLIAAALGALMLSQAARAEEQPGWFERAKNELAQTYREGTPELYVPLYTWHLPFAYTREKINGYQNIPLGLGYGHGRYDEKGNWHGVYALGFQDSHFKPEWMLGYGWKTFWPLTGESKFGLGFTAGLTARTDYGHYAPVPYILPVASVDYGKISWEASYVPGGAGFGNVVFFNAKWRFDGKSSSGAGR